MKKLLVFVLVCSCLGYKPSSCTTEQSENDVQVNQAINNFIKDPNSLNAAKINCFLSNGIPYTKTITTGNKKQIIDNSSIFNDYKRLVTNFNKEDNYYKETLKNLAAVLDKYIVGLFNDYVQNRKSYDKAIKSLKPGNFLTPDLETLLENKKVKALEKISDQDLNNITNLGKALEAKTKITILTKTIINRESIDTLKQLLENIPNKLNEQNRLFIETVISYFINKIEMATVRKKQAEVQSIIKEGVIKRRAAMRYRDWDDEDEESDDED